MLNQTTNQHTLNQLNQIWFKNCAWSRCQSQLKKKIWLGLHQIWEKQDKIKCQITIK